MATPANRTPVRIARGTYANLNASILDLEEGEICYATDTNVIYVVEGGVLTPINVANTNLNANYIREVVGINQTGEPLGHKDRTESTISFNAGTRTFTIQPVGASFDVWCKGIKYTKTTAETVTIPNTTNIYYIYYSNTGVLSYKTTYFDWANDTPTAYIYWNSTTGAAPYFADERHGIVLDWATHEYLHRTRGAVFASGFSISNYTISGSGSVDADAQIDLGGGTFFDEDLEVIVSHSNTPTANTWEQDLQGPAQIPVLYLDGTAWVRDAATNFPLKAGTAYPRYNLLSSGTWSATEATANKFLVQYLVATHNLGAPVMAIMGQDIYDNIGEAEATTFEELVLTNFPSVEFRPLYKLVFQTGAYGNAIGARLRNVLDLRNITATGGGTGVSDHGVLTGLADDDHLQYIHITETRAGISANISTSGTLATTNSTASSNSTTGALVVTGGVGVGGDVNIAGNLTVNGTTTNINTQNLVVEDKNVILGDVATPTDVTADGGGITLKGTTDKTLNWIDATDAWTSSERFSIPAGTAGAPSLTITGDENSGIYSPGANQLGFSTDGTGRMFIDASGNVGIKTATPADDLHVIGSLRIQGVETDATAKTLRIRGGHYTNSELPVSCILTSNGSTDNFITIGGGSTVENAATIIRLFTASNNTTPTGTERLRIASDGFISLGGDTDTGFSNPAANNLAFSTGGSERARIDSSGRLLVGTSSTSEDSLLRIQGNSTSSTATGSISLSRGSLPSGSSSGLGAINFSDNSGNQGAQIIALADGAWTSGSDHRSRLVFSTTSDGSSTPTERMRINSSGQVLIGKTAGTYTSTDTQLEVQNAVYSATGFGNLAYWRLGPVTGITIVNGGSGYTDGTYAGIPLLTDGTAYGVTADFTVSGGVITAATVAQEGRAEAASVGTVLTLQTSTALGAGGVGLSLTVASVRTAYFGLYADPARIRLGNNDASVASDQELGSILFSNRDSSSIGGIVYGGAGDTARIYARAAGLSGGGYFDFWTAASGGQAQSTMWLNHDGTNSILRIRNPGDSNTNFVSVLRAEQATATTARNGGQIVFGRENAQSWAAATANCDGYIAFSPVLDGTNTERMRITSAGFVGIGTTSPVQKLEVAESDSTAVAIRASNSTGNFSLIRTSFSTNELRANDTAPIVFSHTAGTAERARIDSTGRLLVGTSTGRSFDLIASTVTPYLQVEGQFLSSSSLGLCYNAANATGSAIYLGKSRGSTSGANDILLINDTLGYINFEGADSAKLIEGASIYAQVDGTPGVDSMPGRIVLSTTPAGSATPVERLRVTSTGRVGINTTAPISALHVAGDTTVSNVNVASVTYDNISKSISAQEGSSHGVFFKPDGTRLYLTGSAIDTIWEYELSTPWNVSTATLVTSQNVGALESVPQDLFISPDGKKLYLIGSTNDNVLQHTLTRAWDLSSLVYDEIKFSVAAQDTTPAGIWFKPDGLAFYIAGSTNTTIYRYNLSTAWNISTATSSTSLSVSANTSLIYSIAFIHDGSRMLVLGDGDNEVNFYDLTTAWDISTAVYLSAFSVGSQASTPTGLYIKPDGSKFYICDQTTDNIFQYSIPTATVSLTGLVDINGDVHVAQDVIIDGSVKVPGELTLLNSSNNVDVAIDTINKNLTLDDYTINRGWDITKAVYTGVSYSVATQETGPLDIYWKPDGTRFYVPGTSRDGVGEYHVTTPWDISTAYYVDGMYTGYTETSLGGIDFSADGQYLFVIGYERVLWRYYLPVPWSVNGAVLQLDPLPSRYIGDLAAAPTGMFISPDGVYLFVIDTSSDRIRRYTMSTAWDITTASVSTGDGPNSFSIGASPQAVWFKPDGLLVFITDATTLTIRSYVLTTAWDLSTMSSTVSSELNLAFDANTNYSLNIDPTGTKLFIFNDRFNYVEYYELTTAWTLSTAIKRTTQVLNPATDVRGTFFKSDGLKFFAADLGTDAIYEYQLTTAWDILTMQLVRRYYIKNVSANATDIFFKSDGTAFYILEGSSLDILQHSLTTAWQLNTSGTNYLDLFNYDSQFNSLRFDPTGTSLFVLSYQRELLQFSCATPYAIKDATYVRRLNFVREIFPSCFDFSRDGKRLFIGGNNLDAIVQYNLPNRWNIAGAVYSGQLAVGSQDSTLQGIYFKDDGTKFWTVGSTNDSVYEYTLQSETLDINNALNINGGATVVGELNVNGAITVTDNLTSDSITVDSIQVNDSLELDDVIVNESWLIDQAVSDVLDSTADFRNVSIDANTDNPQASFVDGNRMYIVENVTKIVQYSLTDQDITTATYVREYTLPSFMAVAGLTFKSDGTEMVVFNYSQGGTGFYKFILSTAWDISTATYTSYNTTTITSFSTNSQEGTPRGLAWKPDGTKVYVAGQEGDDITQYDLSTAWDLSTATHPSGKVFSHAAYTTQAEGLDFKSDGTEVVLLDSDRNIYTFSLATAWDISTASLKSAGSEISYTSTEFDNATGITIGDSGTKMYVLDYNDIKVYQYTITSYGLPSATSSKSFDLAPFILNNPYGLEFKSDGTQMFVGTNNGDFIIKFDLSTAWDVSTATYSSGLTTVDKGADGTANAYWGLAFGGATAGTRMFIMNASDRTIRNYTLSTAWDPSTAGSVTESFVLPSTSTTYYGLSFSPDGTRMYVADGTPQAIYQYSLTSAWTITGATLVNTFIVNNTISGYQGTTLPTSVMFSPNGLIMFVVDDSTNYVLKFNLSTAWDISTAFFDTYFSVGTGNWYGMDIDPYGNNFYLVNTVNDQVQHYSFGQPYSIYTSTFNNSSPALRPLLSTSGALRKVRFHPDGLSMFILDLSGKVTKLPLAHTFYPFTIQIPGILNFQYLDTSLTAFTFKPDGTKLYIPANTNDRIYELNLSTAWNISTATLNAYFALGTARTSPQSIKWNSDGTRLFLHDNATSAIYQYNATTAWSVVGLTVQSVSLARSARYNNFSGIHIDDSNTKLYLFNGATVYRLTMTTASAISSLDRGSILNISDRDSVPRGIRWAGNGHSLYVIGAANQIIRYTGNQVAATALVAGTSYTIASTGTTNFTLVGAANSNPGTVFTATGAGTGTGTVTINLNYDASIAVYRSARTINNTSTIQGLHFNAAGTKCYLVDSSYDRITEHALTTAWDSNTAVQTPTVAFSIAASGIDNPTDIWIGDTESKVYVLNDGTNTTNAIYTIPFPAGQAGNVSSLVQPNFADFAATRTASYLTNNGGACNFSSDGTKFYVAMYIVSGTLATRQCRIRQFNLSTAWDISTIPLTNAQNAELNLKAYETYITDFTFNSDGTRIWVIGRFEGRIGEVVLNTAWDVGTAQQARTFLPAYTIGTTWQTPFLGNTNLGYGISFLSTTNRLAVVTPNTRSIYEVPLKTAYAGLTGQPPTLNYGTFGQIVDLLQGGNSVLGFDFKPDGMKFYVAQSDNRVYEYSLTSPWDLTTISGVSTVNYLVSGNGETVLRAVRFRPDGRKMYILGNTLDQVQEYTLSTPWSVVSATFVGSSAAITSREGQAWDFYIRENGIDVFIIGRANKLLHYQLTTAWSVTSGLTFVRSFEISREYDYVIPGLYFRPDGKSFYVTSNVFDRFMEFKLNTAWDISTAVPHSSRYVPGYVADSYGLYIDPTGKYMFTVAKTWHMVRFSMPTPKTFSVDGIVKFTGSTELNGGLNVNNKLTVANDGSMQSVVPGFTGLYPMTGCRAFVNFDGTANTNVSGTYSQSGTTVTVTLTNHGLSVGNSINVDATSGTAVDGIYTVATVTSADVFTYTAGTSLTTSGNVTIIRNTIRASFNVSSVTDNGTGDYTVNFTTAMPDTNYIFLPFIYKDNELNDNVIYPRSTPNSAYTTGSVRFYSNYGAYGGVGVFDTPKAHVAIFR